VIASVAAVAWVLFSAKDAAPHYAELFHPDRAGYAFGYLIGGAAIIAGLVWTVLWFVWMREHAPRRGQKSYVVLLCVVLSTHVVIGSLLAGYARDSDARERGQMLTAASEMQATLREAAKQADAGPVDTRPKASGEAGELERMVKQFYAVLREDQVAYRAELTALGFPAFIQPENIGAPGGPARARKGLDRMDAVVAKYRARTEQRLTEYRVTIQNAPIRDKYKSGMLAGFDESMVARKPDRDRLWNLEQDIVDEYRAVVTLLEHPKGRWTADAKGYRFESRADLKAFNGHVAKAQDLAQEQERLRQQTLDRTQDVLAKMTQ
jgi:hypothetical protein